MREGGTCFFSCINVIHIFLHFAKFIVSFSVGYAFNYRRLE